MRERECAYFWRDCGGGFGEEVVAALSSALLLLADFLFLRFLFFLVCLAVVTVSLLSVVSAVVAGSAVLVWAHGVSSVEFRLVSFTC